MAKKKSMPSTVRVWCGKCRGETIHWVRSKYETSWEEVEVIESSYCGVDGRDEYEIIQCAGCESVRFRHVAWFSEAYDETPKGMQLIPTIHVYPKELTGDDSSIERFDDFHTDGLIPPVVLRLYSETLAALSAGAFTLAGGGVRATVEAVCQEQQITKGTLQEKIDTLVSRNLLVKDQADLLHEERYLGNSSLHELTMPDREDLRDGLKIVSWLISTLYVIPKRAERLRKRRGTDTDSY